MANLIETIFKVGRKNKSLETVKKFKWPLMKDVSPIVFGAPK